MNLAICEMCLKRNIVDCCILKKENTKILRMRSSNDRELYIKYVI